MSVIYAVNVSDIHADYEVETMTSKIMDMASPRDTVIVFSDKVLDICYVGDLESRVSRVGIQGGSNLQPMLNAACDLNGRYVIVATKAWFDHGKVYAHGMDVRMVLVGNRPNEEPQFPIA